MPFPPLPGSAPLPGHSDAGSLIGGIMSALAAQARQQQQQQQQSLKDQFDLELKMKKDGWKLVPADSNGLRRRGDLAPGEYTTDPYGRSWTPPAAKPDATPQQTYTDTSNLWKEGARPLDSEGRVAQNTDIPRFRADQQGNLTDTGMFGTYGPVEDQTRVRTPPGSKQSFYMPTHGEQTAETLRDQLRTETAKQVPTIDTEHFSAPVSINHRTGEVIPLKLPAGVTHNEKPDRPDRYTYNHFTDDNGKVNITRIQAGEEGVPEQWNGKAWAPVAAGAPLGAKRSREAQEYRKQHDAERREDKLDEAAQKTADQNESLQRDEIDQWQTKQRHMDVVEALNGGKTSITDPRNGNTVVVEDKNREGLKKLHKGFADQAEAKAQSYQKQARNNRKRMGWGEFERQQQAAAPQAPAQQQAPAPQQGQPKVTSLARVKEYATKYKLSLAEALKEVKASGFSIGR